ncbi:hypothetical protein ABVK25_012418 [Lepraria finkii]|uniref:Uncharacterized protein n=1 Tax=Lepraria finkii TaxID=1340010 RepID=A0ABR4AG76_9LECA
MPHVSDEDPANHSTLFGVDENDRPLWSAHATSDPSKQQPARNTNRTDIISGP